MFKDDELIEPPPDYVETFKVVVLWHAETGQKLAETWEDARGVKLKTHDIPIVIDHEGSGALPPIETETYRVDIERDRQNHLMLSQTWFDEDGRRHRSRDLPAHIEYDVEPWMVNEAEIAVRRYKYFTHGKSDRQAGPSHLHVYWDGVVSTEIWEREGKYRDDGACYVRRDRAGNLRTRGYSRDGESILNVKSNPIESQDREP